MTKTTITADTAVVRKLTRLKDHPRESYTEVLKRLLKKPALKKADVDEMRSLMATYEILSDPQAMRDLAQSIEDVKAGRLYSIDEV